jgi:phage gp36-like protein
MEEVASYLRPRYDVSKAFATTGDGRNEMLVQVTVNIALYYLAHWLPGSMALDGRQELYENAIDWLTRVSKGGAMPDLPTYVGEDGQTDASNPVRFGGMTPSVYDY